MSGGESPAAGTPEKPTVKKLPKTDPSDSDAYEVSTGSEKVKVFRDPELKAWFADGAPPGEGFLGYNKDEAVSSISGYAGNPANRPAWWSAATKPVG